MPDHTALEQRNQSFEPKSSQVLEFATSIIGKLTGSATEEVTKAISALGTVVEKGTIVFLQAFGAVMIVWGCVLRTHVRIEYPHNGPVNGPPLVITGLQPSEFGLMMALGIVLILAGALYDFCAYRWKVQAYNEQRKAVESSGKIMADVAKTGMSTVAEMGRTVAAQTTEVIRELKPQPPKEEFPEPRPQKAAHD